MNCEKIKELILTDYVDNEAGLGQKKMLEEHLAHCPACSEFLNAVKKAAVDPFAGSERKAPPEFIWQKIKEEIISREQENEGLAVSWLEKVSSIFHVPGPALAFSTVIASLLLVTLAVTLRLSNSGSGIPGQEDQLEYSLYSTELSASEADDGFGTSMEQYFL